MSDDAPRCRIVSCPASGEEADRVRRSHRLHSAQPALPALDAAPVADAQRDDFDRGEIIIDGNVFVVRVHDSGRAGSEDHGGRISIAVEEARIRRPLAAADLGIAAGHLLIVPADSVDDRVIARNFRRLRVIADEPHLRRMITHPRIFGRRARHLLHEASLYAFVVLARHSADATFEQAVGGERARVVTRRKAADDAGKRIEGIWIERVGHRRDALGLEIRDCLGDFVAQLNSADALVALLNAGGLAVNFDLEPDTTDACGLHREIAGLAGDAGVRLVPADHRIDGTVSAYLLVDYPVDVDVALGLETGGHKAFDRHDVAGNAALHVGGTSPIDAAVLNGGRPRIVAPAFATADRNDIGMAVEEQGTAAACALQYRDDVGASLVAPIDGAVARVFFQLLPVRFPHVDIEADLAHVIREKLLDLGFVPGDAGNGNHLLQKRDRLVAIVVDPL